MTQQVSGSRSLRSDWRSRQYPTALVRVLFDYLFDQRKHQACVVVNATGDAKLEAGVAAKHLCVGVERKFAYAMQREGLRVTHQSSITAEVEHNRTRQPSVDLAIALDTLLRKSDSPNHSASRPLLFRSTDLPQSWPNATAAGSVA